MMNVGQTALARFRPAVHCRSDLGAGPQRIKCRDRACYSAWTSPPGSRSEISRSSAAWCPPTSAYMRSHRSVWQRLHSAEDCMYEQSRSTRVYGRRLQAKEPLINPLAFPAMKICGRLQDKIYFHGGHLTDKCGLDRKS